MLLLFPFSSSPRSQLDNLLVQGQRDELKSRGDRRPVGEFSQNVKMLRISINTDNNLRHFASFNKSFHRLKMSQMHCFASRKCSESFFLVVVFFVSQTPAVCLACLSHLRGNVCIRVRVFSPTCAPRDESCGERSGFFLFYEPACNLGSPKV